MYTVLQERGNITVSFAEHGKKEDFYNTLGEQWQIKVKWGDFEIAM